MKLKLLLQPANDTCNLSIDGAIEELDESYYTQSSTDNRTETSVLENFDDALMSQISVYQNFKEFEVPLNNHIE